MNRIKEIRKIFKLNQTELAEKLNTTQQTISNWENGVTDIDIDSLLLISNTFDLSVDYILCKTDLNIGERIKQLRLENGMTQVDLAEKLHIAPNTYNQYENGKRQIPDDIKIALANLYDVSLDYLMGTIKTNISNLFSSRLKDLRTSRNLTQIAFANEFGISNGTIAMWETNKRQPEYNTLIKIADYFNVSVDYLLGRDYKNDCTITKNNYYNTKSDRNIFKILRIKNNLSQNDVAMLFNVTQSAISKWETGVALPDSNLLTKIAKFYNVTVDYILDKTNNLQLKNEDITMDKPLNILIRTAQGNRTHNAFALDCGIDSSSLTRILNGENTPKPEILKKISVKAQNNVSYTDLMIAAGFIDINEIKEYFSNDHKTNLLETNLNNSLIVVKNNKIQSFQFSESEIDAILILLNKCKN